MCPSAPRRLRVGLIEWVVAELMGGTYLFVRLWGALYFVEYVFASENKRREKLNLKI
jgi:hypothetical protein